MKYNSIITDRLKIVQFQSCHITDQYISWLNDKELMQFSEQRHKQHTLISCEKYLDSFLYTDNLFLAIEDLSKKLLGTLTVYCDKNNDIVEIGIMIGAKSVRSTGIGSEAWSSIIKWISYNIKPRKITAGCMASNNKMINIINNCGMQPDGIRKNHYIYNGDLVDVLYWTI